QRYINPKADAKRLVHVSYFSSALLIIVGLIISVFGTSINAAFLWIFGTLAAGILPPNVLRWYWWRLNGWGYAAGVFGGMVLSLGQVVLDTTFLSEPLPLYIGFPVIALASSILTIVVSLSTEPTSLETLKVFYRKVQPAGFWAPPRAAVLSEDPDFKKQTPFARDVANTLIALVGITALYVSMLYLILHQLTIAFSLIGTTVLTVVILYFTWYKHLPPAREAGDYDESEVAMAAAGAEFAEGK
ncbi:MAG: hypothetical protein R2682_14640, partial [Pyrinomonadaceae bacterium]